MEAEVVVAARNLSTPRTPGRVLVQAYWSPEEWVRFALGRGARVDPEQPREARIVDALGDVWLFTCAVALFGPALAAWDAAAVAA